MNRQQTIKTGSDGSPNLSAHGRLPRSGGPERSANRAIGAAIVAGGLAFSASLYPVPDESQQLELFPPNDKLSEFVGWDGGRDPRSVASKLLNQEFPDFSMLELRDLTPLVELLNHNPDFPTDGLLNLVKTYGLPDLVKSLELLNTFEPLTRSFLVPLGGGGGASGVPTTVLQALAILLEFLQQNSPPSSGYGLSDVLARVFPTLVKSFGIPQTPAAPLPEAQVSVFAEAPAFAATEAPTFAATEAPAFAPTEAAAAPPTEAPVIAPTEAPVIAPTEAPVSALPEAGDLAPDLPEVALPESDPPTSDPQSPEGGSGGGSSGGTDGGSSGGTDGGSSGGTDGGSSGGSDGGSSGDE